MNAATLQKKRRERIAAKNKATGYGYDPSVQKPTSLEPIKQGHRFHYWGPPPDAGFSYGAYVCENCKGNVISTAGIQQFCPTCGFELKEPTQAISKKVIDQAITSSSFGEMINICPSCEKEIITSITPLLAQKLNSVYCSQCGTNMPIAMDALKAVSEDMEYDEDEDEILPAEGEDEEEDAISPASEDEDTIPPASEDEDTVPPSPEGEDITPPASDDEGTAPPSPEGEEGEEDTDEEKEDEFIETIPDLDTIGDIEEDDIEMFLSKKTDNPYWDVYIKEQPIARINLKAIENHEEIQARFLDEKLFPKDIKTALVKFGCNAILSNMNARKFAYQVNRQELTTKIRAEVNADFANKQAKKLTELKDRFLKAITLAATAANVNFFKGTDNTIREFLSEQMTKVGVSDPDSIITAAFDKHQVPYVESLLNKAEELVNMDSAALAAVEEAINNANPLPAKYEYTKTENLKQKLAKGNLPIIASSGERIEGNSTLSPDNYKQTLKKRINLRGKNYF